MNQAIHTQNLGLTADSLPASSNNPFILSSYKKFMTKTVSKAEGKRSFQEPAGTGIWSHDRAGVFIFLDRCSSSCSDESVPAEWCLVVDC